MGEILDDLLERILVREVVDLEIIDEVVGGGIANTFIAAAGYNVGKSLYEADLLDTARALMDKVEIPLPTDVVVATEFSDKAEAVVRAVADVQDDEMVLDIGPETASRFGALLKDAGTILNNMFVLGEISCAKVYKTSGQARSTQTVWCTDVQRLLK